MEDELQLLETMVADMGQQKGIYRPGPYWKTYARRIANAIRTDGLRAFRSNCAVGKGYVDVMVDDPLTVVPDGWKKSLLLGASRAPVVSSLVRRYKRLVLNSQSEALNYKSRLFDALLGEWLDGFAKKYNLPDTLVADPQRVLTISNRKIGELYLRMFAWIHGYAKHVDLTKVTTVFEIGGGFGAMAHTLTHLYPNIRKYLYLDIPPILYVSTQYLKHFYGDAVIDYSRTRGLERIEFSRNDDLEIIMIAPWQIARVEAEVDLFWNSSSFQEMPAETVSNYASHLGRLLRPSGKACVFVYDTENTVNALSTASIRTILQREAKLQLDEIDNPIANLILPGASLIGSRPTSAP